MSLGLKENFSRIARHLNVIEYTYGIKITIALPMPPKDPTGIQPELR